MLYKLKNSFKEIEKVPFENFSDLEKLEKDLENLIADNLLGNLFENSPLMPIFQERKRQSEADIYALDKNGDLIIFELKRGEATADAMQQLLKYCQDAGQWTFNELEEKYKKFIIKEKKEYKKNKEISLIEDHKEAFNLEHPLSPSNFNRKQHLFIIGNAADEKLINAIEYWKNNGLSIEFVPYRVYKINNEYYFEMFTPPYDRHINPNQMKGVLFDTNRSYNENSVWEMIENSRVAAYGGAKDAVKYLNKNDFVFLYHSGMGIIAAGKVKSDVKSDGPEEKYRDIEFLTNIPKKETGIKKYMKPDEVSKITGKSFYWARTIKVPYLSLDEAKKLLNELNKIL